MNSKIRRGDSREIPFEELSDDVLDEVAGGCGGGGQGGQSRGGGGRSQFQGLGGRTGRSGQGSGLGARGRQRLAVVQSGVDVPSQRPAY
jgi:hypothetical protein